MCTLVCYNTYVKKDANKTFADERKQNHENNKKTFVGLIISSDDIIDSIHPRYGIIR